MKTEQKIYAAVAILALLGGLLYWRHSSAQAAKDSSKSSAERPTLALNPEDVERITKLEFTQEKKDKKGSETVVLEKGAGGWELTAPIKAKANSAEVDSLLKSLQKLKVVDTIETTSANYAGYDVADGKGIHFTAYKGTDKALDLILGTSGERGQMVRVIGKDGVWALGKDEYKATLFNKEAKNWRDKTILSFDEKDVVSVDVENKHGHYVFTRDGDNWKGAYDRAADAPPLPEEDGDKKDGDKKDADKKDADKKDDKKDDKKEPGKKDDKKEPGKKDADKKDADKKAPKKDDNKAEGTTSGAEQGEGDQKGDKPAGKKDADKKDADKKDADKKDADADKKDADADAPPLNPGWEKFDGKNVETLIGAFKKLNALDFADAGTATGLDAAAKEGGIIKFKMKNGDEIVLLLGKNQKGTARYAQKQGDPTIYVVQGHQADWVSAAPTKFEKKAKKPGADPHGHGGPGGPGGPHGMPPGMPGGEFEIDPGAMPDEE